MGSRPNFSASASASASLCLASASSSASLALASASQKLASWPRKRTMSHLVSIMNYSCSMSVAGFFVYNARYVNECL